MANDETKLSNDVTNNPVVQYPLQTENSRVSTSYSLYEFIENEFKEEEERDMVVYRVREAILKRILDRLDETNEEERVQARMVDCFVKALKTLVDWYYIPRDPEDVPLDWDRDFEIKPLQPDNWASFTAPYQNYPPDNRFQFHRGPRMTSFLDDADDSDEEVDNGGDDDDGGVTCKGGKKKNDDFDKGFTPHEDSIGAVDWSSSNFFEETSIATAGATTHVTRESSKRSRKSKSRVSLKMHTAKREIGLFINPKEFPPMRVTPEIQYVPGESFSPKVCGKKMEIKTYIVKSVKPRKLSSVISEQEKPMPRSYTF